MECLIFLFQFCVLKPTFLNQKVEYSGSSVVDNRLYVPELRDAEIFSQIVCQKIYLAATMSPNFYSTQLRMR